MENKIILITPPDKIFNQNHSCLLIHPSNRIKEQAQDILSKSQGRQNIYLYEPEDEEQQDLDWLLTVSKMCDTVVLDLDNSSYEVRMYASYIISLPQTYWLTAEDSLLYNKLSPNRIYGLDVIEHLIGGNIEEQS